MSITFNIQQGGLGRRLPGRDYVSGFVFAFTNANLPTGFATDDRIKKVESLDEAVALGINGDVGTAAEIRALHYHISEFFLEYEGKTQSIGELWLNLYDNTSNLAAGDITDLQTAAEGEIRQFYAWTNLDYAASLVTTCGTAAATMLTNKQPAIIVLGTDTAGADTVADLTSIRTLDQQFVSVDIAQDGSAIPTAIQTALGTPLGSGGTMLGLIAAANVAHNIGWVQNFNIADSVRYQNPKVNLMDANGVDYSSLTDAEVASLVTLGYMFIRTRTGINGAFYNDTPQAVAADNDFAFIENSRTIQKVLREIDTQLVPFINAPLTVNATTGHLTETTIFELESAVFRALNQMGADFEISVDPATGRLPNNAVFIDPDQNVLSTSQVRITVRIVPIGVQRETIVNIGFTPQLNQAA